MTEAPATKADFYTVFLTE